MPSAQEIQEQMRRSQQLIGLDAGAQQPFHPVAPGANYPSNYAPFVPQMPYQVGGAQNGGKPRGIPVSMGKLSLLAISFSLMLLGAFTFLGGFLLGVWVAGPRVSHSIGGYIPQQQSVPYSLAYPQRESGQHGANPESDLSRRIGSVAEAAIKDREIEGMPRALSPLFKAAQSEVGKRVGEKTEDLLKQQTWISHPAAPQQYSPPSAAPVQSYPAQPSVPTYPSTAPIQSHPSQPSEPTHLPVVTPSGIAPTSFAPVAQENEGNYTVQLGVFASIENANALVNHMQAISYPSQVTEGKAPDGSKIYYVHSGIYRDYATAQAAASQFVSQNIPGAIIVRFSQPHKNVL